jgi:electron transfer flavoprotein alpha subunit
MAVTVTEECVGCGTCEPVCPFGAIETKDGFAIITEACTQCGACIDTCPVGAILREIEAKQVAMDKSKYKDVWVYIEISEGKPRNVGLKLLSEGRKLADAIGQNLAGVLLAITLLNWLMSFLLPTPIKSI